ncbi:thiamine diphosphokinase [Spiroplasma culicicola]|uniref:Thiamine diphosphokinase n=1 Tax=Spiroplasma culicicola AES-1 TaxID=1276246 RepID=W6A8B6_9MOLU|nr:thiamine diphosphokinase [Spiroplasma culicicola]AHI53191.1 thiamine pyrophosphokinase [Spiroplasma culicicola AES-1]
MKTKFLIVACQNNLNFDYYKDYFIIGVERGCLDLIDKNITIDLALADFDHVIAEELELIKSKAKETIVLNPEKDFLDGKEAINIAYQRGAQEILFIAKPTKRVDMNLSLIEICTKDKVTILNDDSIMFLISKGEFEIDFNRYQDYTYISLFPVHQTVIDIKGLKYEVENLSLLPHSTRAFSNCFDNQKNGFIKTDKPIILIFNK